MALDCKFDFDAYQSIIERCGSDSAFRDELLKSPRCVFAEYGVELPPSGDLASIAEFACGKFSSAAFSLGSSLRPDELESPVACTNNSKSRSGPWTNATNCYKSCGLCIDDADRFGEAA